MMTSAPRPRRAFRALFGLSCVVAAGLASCANGETTGIPDGSSGGDAARAGFAGTGATGTAAAGHSQGGSSGANAAAGGSVNSGGSGNATAAGGTGTGGFAGTLGVAGTFGSAGTFASAGTGGTGGTLGSGGQSGGGGSSAGGSSGSGAGRSAGGFGQGGRGGMSSGGMSSGGMSSGGMGGAWGVAPPANIQNGQQGWASRYWDCCKPACGWSANVGGRQPAKACDKSGTSVMSDVNAKNACESGGSAFACYGDKPWAVGDKLAYGFVAKNDTCGRCFHLQFTGSSHNGGDNAGAKALNGKHMIVQVINNGGIASDQMDLLIPGGGVGALNACTNQWGTSDLGSQYGGFLAGCNGDLTCVKNKCQQVFAGKQDLLDGCDWFLGWYAAADNPNFTYEKVACPSDITQHSGLSDPG